MLLILNLWNDVLFLRGDHWSPFFSSPNFVRDSALDVPFFPAGDQWSPLHSFFVGAVIGRPFLVSKTSYETAPSTFFFPAGDQWSPLHSFFVGAVIGRPFLVSKTSYGTAPSTSLLLPSFPFPHSNTLRQADMACLIY